MEKTIVKVKVKHGTGKAIAKLFKVSTVFVSLAVTGKCNSELAKKVRNTAVEMGGDPIYDNN